MFKNIPPEMLSMAQALERAISRDSELEIDSIQNKARWLKLIKEQNETIATLRAENARLRQELDEAREDMEHWKGCNLYPATYREAVEQLKEATGQLDEARSVIKGIWNMACEDVREGTEGVFTAQIEADARTYIDRTSSE